MKNFPKGDKNNALWWVISVLLFVTGRLSALGVVLAILNIMGKLPPLPELIAWIRGQTVGGSKGGETTASGKVDPATGRVTWDEPKKEQSAEERLRREARQAAEEVRRAAEEVRSAARQATASAPQQTAPASRRKKTLKKPKAGGFRLGLGITLMVLGLILALYSAGNIAGLFMGQIFTLSGYMLPTTLPAFLSYTAIGGLMLVAGILLTVFGGAARGKANARYRRLSNLLQMLGVGAEMPIQSIADMAGRPYSQTLSDLQELIDMGYFEDMWIDRAAGMLRRRPYSAEAEQSAEETRAETLSEAERILRQIRADNDLIDDEAISGKIDVIEDLTRKIFAFQEKNPDKADENRTFMNYYLPQTLKLLETYARLEASGADVANVHTTKQKISEGLDKLIGGFQRHLDKLYSSDVIDITADIRVMEQMLEKDGLTEDRFAR